MKGCDSLKKETIDRFTDALLIFVERASNPNATTEEVEALAAVARVLADILR